MTIIGLDLSLTHSGFAILQEDGKVLVSGVIKSKPCGDKPIDETKRIKKIIEDLCSKIDDNLAMKEKPVLVVIEGLAFMARNSTALVQLSGLNYLIRSILVDNEWPFLIVAPTTLKKFITGSGKGDKNQMMMHVYKNYGFEALDDNECDAYSLAVCGLAVIGKSVNNLLKPQVEVVSLLKKQLN